MNKIRHPKKRMFLMAYSQVGNVLQAAKLSKVNRGSHYTWIESDPDYAAAFSEARQAYGERLEAEMLRRAVEGVDRPVFWRGKQVGEIREFSDVLLIFALRANMPWKYCDRRRVEHGGAGGDSIRIDAGRQELLADPQTLEVASQVYLERLRQGTSGQS